MASIRTCLLTCLIAATFAFASAAPQVSIPQMGSRKLAGGINWTKPPSKVAITGTRPVTVTVTRPGHAATPNVEVIEYEFVRYVTRKPLALHIFINQANANSTSLKEGNPHYLTSIYFLAEGNDPATGVKTISTSSLTGVRPLIKDDKQITVTIVPIMNGISPKEKIATVKVTGKRLFGP